MLNLPSELDNEEYLDPVGVWIAKIVAPGSNSEAELFTIPLILDVVVWPITVVQPKTKNNKIIIFFISLDVNLYVAKLGKKKPLRGVVFTIY
jgi:hypothetical protein